MSRTSPKPTNTIVGSYLSPYVRKVLVSMHLKGLPYEIDPIVPFYGDDRFSEISPVRRIPVLIDDRVTLCDSSVICQYLEDRYPEPALYPADIADRASARWLEEFADSRMGDVFIWQLFNQLAIGPNVWKRPPDATLVERTRSVDIPNVLDYLEPRLPANGYLFGAVSVADVAIACFFRNAQFVRYEIDAARWPVISAFVARMLGHPAFEALRPFEEASLRAPPNDNRDRLRAAGAPLTDESFGTDRPRDGIMRIG